MGKLVPLKKGLVEQSVSRADGWLNTLTGIGTTRDKRLAGGFFVDTMDPDQCEELYRGNDTAARIAEAVPDEMTREWVSLQVGDDVDAGTITEIIEVTEKLNLQASVRDALCLSRALGGAGIVVGYDDNMDPSEEVIPERVKGIKYLTTMDCRELIPVSWYQDPFDPRCGLPMMYQVRPIVPNSNIVSPSGSSSWNAGMPLPMVHETRVLRFDGVRTSRRQRLTNRGWGESVFVRCNEVLRDFNMSWASAANLMSDYAQGVLKVKGLAELLATGEDNVIVRRAQMMDMSRSVARMLILDSEEEFTREVASLGGLDAMLDKMSLRLAAAAKMPVSLLMGQAPAGLNATGDSDIRFFYDQVAAMQRKHILPILKTIMPYLCLTAGVEVPEGAVWTFNRLWQMTDKEQAELRSTVATADVAYINAQVLTPEEVAVSRFGGGKWTMETVIDVEARRELAEKRREASIKALDNSLLGGDEEGGATNPPKGDHADGDLPGHPFRGNQWTVAEEGSPKRAWQGRGNQVKKFLSKIETGTIGEELAREALSKVGISVESMHRYVSSATAVDLISKTHAVEVKAGVYTSTTPAWRNTYNPTAEEKKIIESLSPEEVTKYHARRYADRAKRMEKLSRGKIKLTVGVIVNPDKRVADIHIMEGHHKSIGWRSKDARENYRATRKFKFKR